MSNADRCAREGCGRDRNNSDHWNLQWPGHHAFVEPAPQPAPIGDEAKLREIAERWFIAWSDDDAPPSDTVLRSAVREAYAAGKADEREAIVSEFMASACASFCVHERCISFRSAADVIARRGSEGT